MHSKAKLAQVSVVSIKAQPAEVRETFIAFSLKVLCNVALEVLFLQSQLSFCGSNRVSEFHHTVCWGFFRVQRYGF